VIIWTISLGILTSFTVGSTITVPTPEAEALVTVIAFVISSVSLYPLVVRNWDRWSREQPLVRIVVYFAPLFFVIVVLDTLVHLLFGGWGLTTMLLEAAVVAATFALTIWLSFYGGAYRVKDYVVANTSLNW